MDFPKLKLVGHVYNRPEPSGTVGEVLKEYLSYKAAKGSADPAAEVRGEVELAIKDRAAELKDLKG